MRVFLSHSSTDKPVVRELAAFLEAHNFQPWLDEKEIATNDNFPHDISEGLDKSQAVLVFHSAASATSRWVRDEWAAALDLNLLTALVKLDDTPIPALLRIRQHFDLRTNQPEAFRAIVTWLTGQKRTIAQRFTAPSRAPLFVGRETELQHLRDRLNRQGEILAITGDPGRGKSALALEFAWSYRQDFHAVHWLQCTNTSTDAIAADLAYQLGFQLQGDPDKMYRQLRDHCSRQGYLLIFDNIDDQDLSPLLPGGQSNILITTRHKTLPFLGLRKPLPLDLLPESDCLALFQQVLEDQYEEQPARDLSRRLGFLVVAISVAAGLVKNDIRHSLKSLYQNLPPLDKLTFGQDNVGNLLTQAINSTDETARNLLQVMAACSPSGFRLSLAAAVAGISEQEAQDAAQQLWHHRSLIELVDKTTQRYRLHTLVRLAAAPTEAQRARHAALVADQFENWQQNWQQCEEDFADLQEAFNWVIAPWEQPTLPAPSSFLWNLVGRLAYAGFRLTELRGRWSDSLQFCERRAAAAERAGDRAVLQAWLGNQALILQSWGRFEEAMALLNQQEAICVDLADRIGLSTCYGNQALILQNRDRPEEAMALHKQQETICLEVGDRAGLQRSYGNQANILQQWNQLEEAMVLYKKQEALCVDIRNRADLQGCYGNQALILQDWDRLDEALALHKKEEAICLELGDRSALASSWANQAILTYNTGDHIHAIDLTRRALEVFEQLGMPAETEFARRNLARFQS